MKRSNLPRGTDYNTNLVIHVVVHDVEDACSPKFVVCGSELANE